MTPYDFERVVARLLETEGYRTAPGSYVGDWGVDVLATRGQERVAVQAKMYKGTLSAVNRRMVFELYGAAAYFDCTGSIIATDGRILPSAQEAAAKLGVRILYITPKPGTPVARTVAHPASAAGARDFSAIWQRSIVPLAGQTLTRPNGGTNRIVAVNGSGIERITSAGEEGHVPIETLRWAMERVLGRGQVTREEINAECGGRVSSGVALILSQVPEFEVGGRPTTIRLRSTPNKSQVSRG